MNVLPIDKQAIVIGALVEGCSIRSIERQTRIHRDTIMRLGVAVGEACEVMLDHEMRGLSCTDVQADEIWCYVGKKQKQVREEDDPNTCGDFWTYVAIDRDTKLVPAFRVGKRDYTNTQIFVSDLKARLWNRVQLSTDGLTFYAKAVEKAFGGEVDYGQIVKRFEATEDRDGRYSPPHVVSVEKDPIVGAPLTDRICTSHVERQNLTMRMQMRRFTRLTNGFSKKVRNLRAAVSLHFAWYNMVRKHSALKMTPAQAAQVAERKWTIMDLVRLPRD